MLLVLKTWKVKNVHYIVFATDLPEEFLSECHLAHATDFCALGIRHLQNNFIFPDLPTVFHEFFIRNFHPTFFHHFWVSDRPENTFFWLILLSNGSDHCSYWWIVEMEVLANEELFFFKTSYLKHRFLSSATWPLLPKKHYNGLNQTKSRHIVNVWIMIQSRVLIWKSVGPH